MDKVVAEVKKVEEWLNQCHCTLLLDGNNSSLLSILLKVGFCWNEWTRLIRLTLEG
jgi:histone demethylase JARID1